MPGRGLQRWRRSDLSRCRRRSRPPPGTWSQTASQWWRALRTGRCGPCPAPPPAQSTAGCRSKQRNHCILSWKEMNPAIGTVIWHRMIWFSVCLTQASPPSWQIFESRLASRSRGRTGLRSPWLGISGRLTSVNTWGDQRSPPPESDQCHHTVTCHSLPDVTTLTNQKQSQNPRYQWEDESWVNIWMSTSRNTSQISVSWALCWFLRP